jgi:hypothetical protein
MRGTSRAVAAVGAVALLLVAVDAVPVAAQPGTGGPPTVVVTPELVNDAGRVEVEISGFTEPALTSMVICKAAAVEATTVEAMWSLCAGLGALPPDADLPPAHVIIHPRRTFGTVNTGELVDCTVVEGGCVIGVFQTELPDRRLLDRAFDTIRFHPLVPLAVTPTTDLLEGQVVSATASGLAPGWYRVDPCASTSVGDCAETGPQVLVGEDGTLEVDVPVSPRLTAGGRHVYCRTQCLLGLSSAAEVRYLWHVGYAMAEGSLTVSPGAGLSDGQTVDVAGERLMPTYAGPPLPPFPTGTWSLTQCDRGVLDEPSLLGVFAHCAAAPLTRPVTVDEPELHTTFAVQATITRIQGGTTDCAAAPGACVVGLVRLEQDGSLSHHLQPIRFGS